MPTSAGSLLEVRILRLPHGTSWIRTSGEGPWKLCSSKPSRSSNEVKILAALAFTAHFHTSCPPLTCSTVVTGHLELHTLANAVNTTQSLSFKSLMLKILVLIVYCFLGRLTLWFSFDLDLVLLKAGIWNAWSMKCRYAFVFINDWNYTVACFRICHTFNKYLLNICYVARAWNTVPLIVH